MPPLRVIHGLNLIFVILKMASRRSHFYRKQKIRGACAPRTCNSCFFFGKKNSKFHRISRVFSALNACKCDRMECSISGLVWNICRKSCSPFSGERWMLKNLCNDISRWMIRFGSLFVCSLSVETNKSFALCES